MRKWQQVITWIQIMSSSCNSGSNLSASNHLRVDSRPRQDAEIAPDRAEMKSGPENGIGELVVVFVKVRSLRLKEAHVMLPFFTFFSGDPHSLFHHSSQTTVRLRLSVPQYANGKATGTGGVLVWWCIRLDTTTKRLIVITPVIFSFCCNAVVIISSQLQTSGTPASAMMPELHLCQFLLTFRPVGYDCEARFIG